MVHPNADGNQPQSRAAQGEDRDAAERDGKQNWDRGLGCARREQQLEQRIGITQSVLQGSERTVTAPYEQRNTLRRQGHQRRTKDAVASTSQRAKPDVGKAAEPGQGDRDMRDSQSLGPAA